MHDESYSTLLGCRQVGLRVEKRVIRGALEVTDVEAAAHSPQGIAPADGVVPDPVEAVDTVRRDVVPVAAELGEQIEREPACRRVRERGAGAVDDVVTVVRE